MSEHLLPTVVATPILNEVFGQVVEAAEVAVHRASITSTETESGTFVASENTSPTEAVQPGFILLPADVIAGAVIINGSSTVTEEEPTGVDENGNTPLIRASMTGDICFVRDLLQDRTKEAYINAQNICGSTALMIASLNGFSDIVSELLAAGAAVDLCDDCGGYPLVSAVCNGHLRCAQALLAAGADRDRIVDLPGVTTTPLFEAVHSGDIEMVHLLLDNGANVSTADKDGRDALYRAINTKDVDVVELVMSHGRNLNDRTCYGGTLLMHYVTHCWVEGVSLLLRLGSGTGAGMGTNAAAIKIDAQDSTGRTALIYAVICGWSTGVQLLIDYHANLHIEDFDGVVALVYAAEQNDMEVVRLLLCAITDLRLKTGVYFPLYVGNALLGAARSGHADMVSTLLEFDSSVINSKDDSGDTALMEAASRSHMSVVEVLLEWGGRAGETYAVDLEVVNEEGDTALTAAVKRGFARLVKMLLEAGAAVNHEPLGVSPLLLAVSNHYDLSCPRLLIEYGADANSVTFNGTTALMLAVTAPRKEALVPELIRAGADVNARDSLRETVLHKIAKIRTCSLETLLVLLNSGLDINAQTDINRETALMFATKRLWVEGIRALLLYDADTDMKDSGGRMAVDWARQQGRLFPRPSDSLLQVTEEVENMLERQSKWRRRRHFIMLVIAYFKYLSRTQEEGTVPVADTSHSVARDRCFGNMDMCYEIVAYL